MKEESGIKDTSTGKVEDFLSVNVDTVLNKLKQLALQTKKKNGTSNQEQWKQYEYLATEVAELARQRNEVHIALEIETIKSSRKRSCFQVLPIQYAEEMKAAVLAAREMNESYMKELKERNVYLKRETICCEKKLEKLSAENTELIPQCDLIQREYDELIVQLNRQFSKKSIKQIKLNETRQMLHEFQSQIDEIDSDMLNLAENMNNERQKADNLRNKLNEEIKEVQEALAKQNELNVEDKRLNRTYMELTLERASKICGRKRSIVELENEIPRLMKEGEQLTSRIERKRKTIMEIKDVNVRLQAKLSEERAQYMEKVNALEETLGDLHKQLDEVKEENKQVVEERNTILLQLQKLQKTFKTVTQKLGALSTYTIQDAKKRTPLKLTSTTDRKQRKTISVIELAASRKYHDERKKELAELNDEFLLKQGENQDKMEKIEGVKKYHRVAKRLLLKQIEEQKITLEVEKQERVETQKLRDESEKALERFVQEESDYMTKKKEEVDDATSEHVRLTERSLCLLRENANNGFVIDTLYEEVDVARGRLSRLNCHAEQEIFKIERSIELIENEKNKFRDIYNEKEPEIIKLRQEVKSLDGELHEQKLKDTFISNKFKTLIEQKNRARMLIGKLNKPTKMLKSQIKSVREDGVTQLESHSTQRSIIETGIYFITHKLEAIVHENEVLTEHSDEMSDDMAELLDDIEVHTLHQKNLYQDLKDIDDQFQAAWAYAIEIEKKLYEEGHDAMSDLTIVQRDTKERSDNLAGITSTLRNNVEDLTNIIDGVKDRKPDESRDPRRRSSVRAKRSSLNQQPDEKLIHARRRSSRLTAHSNRSSVNSLLVRSSRQRRFSGAISRRSLADSDLSSGGRRPSDNDQSGAEASSPSVTKPPSVERIMAIHLPGLEPRQSHPNVATG